MMLHDLRVTSSQADALIQLPALPDAPRAGRRFVRVVLQIRGAAEFEDAALLCTSELVTNAVNAANGLVVLSTVITERLIRIEVWDTDAGIPAPRTAGPGDEGGRGLVLVGALSDRWGSELPTEAHVRGSYKVTWCEWDRIRAQNEPPETTNVINAIHQ